MSSSSPEKLPDLAESMDHYTEGVIRYAALPRTPQQWFMRRIALEGRIKEFRSIRRMFVEKEGRTWNSAFWPAARAMGYEHWTDEKRKCKLLESRKAPPLSQMLTTAFKREAIRQRETLMAKKDGQTNYYDDVQWAFHNWTRYLERGTDGKWAIGDQGKAAAEAPSTGAYGLLQWAAEDLKAFQGMCARVLAKSVEADLADDRHDADSDVGLEDLRRLASSL